MQRRQRDGSTVAVSCPAAICQYTKQMGGVDRLDHCRGSYSVSKKIKALVAKDFLFHSWLIYSQCLPEYSPQLCSSRDSFTMFQFKVLLFRALLCNYSSRDRRSKLSGRHFVGRHSTHKAVMQKNPKAPDEVRLKSVGVHMPQALDSFHRCRLCSSWRNNKCSKIQCDTCGVALCITPCVADFHSH